MALAQLRRRDRHARQWGDGAVLTWLLVAAAAARCQHSCAQARPRTGSPLAAVVTGLLAGETQHCQHCHPAATPSWPSRSVAGPARAQCTQQAAAACVQSLLGLLTVAVNRLHQAPVCARWLCATADCCHRQPLSPADRRRQLRAAAACALAVLAAASAIPAAAEDLPSCRPRLLAPATGNATATATATAAATATAHSPPAARDVNTAPACRCCWWRWCCVVVVQHGNTMPHACNRWVAMRERLTGRRRRATAAGGRRRGAASFHGRRGAAATGQLGGRRAAGTLHTVNEWRDEWMRRERASAGLHAQAMGHTLERRWHAPLPWAALTGAQTAGRATCLQCGVASVRRGAGICARSSFPGDVRTGNAGQRGRLRTRSLWHGRARGRASWWRLARRHGRGHRHLASLAAAKAPEDTLPGARARQLELLAADATTAATGRRSGLYQGARDGSGVAARFSHAKFAALRTATLPPHDGRRHQWSTTTSGEQEEQPARARPLPHTAAGGVTRECRNGGGRRRRGLRAHARAHVPGGQAHASSRRHAQAGRQAGWQLSCSSTRPPRGRCADTTQETAGGMTHDENDEMVMVAVHGEAQRAAWRPPRPVRRGRGGAARQHPARTGGRQRGVHVAPRRPVAAAAAPTAGALLPLGNVDLASGLGRRADAS